jgi:superfamily II DNA or RNA helicase
MAKAVLTNRIFLEVNPELQSHLLRSLTYKIPQYRDDLPPKILTNARIIKDGLMSIPSGRMDLIPEDYEIVNRRYLDFVDFPPFLWDLRPNQAAVHDHVASDCFINANTSWGKTFTGLKIAGKLEQRTLVIVHTLALRDQWIAECEKVYGFTPSIIGSGRFDTSMPISIGNIQTLYRVAGDKINKSFGTIIVDECHHIPSRTFSALIDANHAFYKIGLSASAKRKDGLHVLFPDYFSKKVFKPEEENRMVPTIHRVKLPIRVADGEQPWAVKINDLADNEVYQRTIALMAASYVAKGHKVLVLSNRTKLVERAHDITPKSVLITGSTKDRTKQLEKMRDGSHSVLYGSLSIFAEGVSENYLSCLIIATPINNEPLLDQLIGRVIRKQEGKIKPVVVMPLLMGKTVEKQQQLMKGYFMRAGYEVIDL